MQPSNCGHRRIDCGAPKVEGNIGLGVDKHPQGSLVPVGCEIWPELG